MLFAFSKRKYFILLRYYNQRADNKLKKKAGKTKGSSRSSKLTLSIIKRRYLKNVLSSLK